MDGEKRDRAADQTTLTFSLPKSLKAKISDAAKADNRSASNWLVTVLQENLPTPTFPLLLRGEVAAGEPASASVEEELQVAREYPGDHYALRISGPSMSPTMEDGDVVVVRGFSRPRSPGNNRVYLFEVGGELTIKRFQRGRKGEPHRLVCDNGEYPPVEPDEDTVPVAEFVEVLDTSAA